jgi:endoglucanase
MQQQRRGWQVILVIALLAVLTTIGVVRAVAQVSAQSQAHANVTTTTTVNTSPNATPMNTPTATATPTPLLPGLHVDGTRFVNDAGQTVRLVGASRQSLEYLCHGDGHFGLADFQAMRAWGMNAVRISLSSEFWSGAGGNCTDYHTTVAQAVFNAESAGLYVILDLQWDAPFDTAYDRTHGGVQCPMPDAQRDVQFWRDLATIYANDHAVLFDLFSEPHDVSWDTWLHGGTITGGCYIINGAAGAGVENMTYQAIGMQALVNDVRAIAPQNILILSGLNWGYDLSGISQGYAVQGTNLVYGTHPFNYANKQPGDWAHDFGDLAMHVPVLATEFGSYDCATGYIGTAISYFDQHQMSWLAWAWNVGDCGGPSLLANWDGTPTQPYGAYIQAQVQAMARGTGA